MNIQIAQPDALTQLVQIYHDEPVTFAEQILNVEPDEQQQDVLSCIYNEKKKTSVKSGRGAGKTWVAGMVIWHFLCTRSMSQVYITAPAGGNIQGAIWPTLGKLYANMNPIYKDQFEFQTTQIKHKIYPHVWFAITRTARIENPDSLAGSHAKHMLYLIDEASGVSDEMFRVITGSLTEDKNYLLMLSNPRRLSGFFYKSHLPLRKVQKEYNQLHMSAIKSRWVSKESIEHWKNLYGEDSNVYKIEVLGEFPDREDSAVIPLSFINKALDREKPELLGDIRWGLDMGAGSDKSVLIKRQGNYVFPDIKKWNYKDTMKTVAKIAEEYLNTPDELKPTGIYVDTIGVGKGTGDRLRELELPIIPAVASKKAVKKKYIFNAKSEWWLNMMEWFRDDKPSIPNDNDLIEELSTCMAVPSNDGRFKIEMKDKFKSRLGRSPDSADALAMTFSQRSRLTVGLTTG
jgi:hypothetical protein